MNRMNEQIDDAGSAAQSPRFLPDFLRQLKVSILATFVLAVIVSGVYPGLVWGLAQALFHQKANGSLIGKDGQPVTDEKDAIASALIGQGFSDARYFHPRPSSAGNGYDPTSSAGSNLGPTSAKLINGTIKTDEKGSEVVDFDGIRLRIVHYCDENKIEYYSSIPLDAFRTPSGNLDDVKLIKAFNADPTFVLTPRTQVPADAVTGSGSGLDPHISVANALIQAKRVSVTRNLPLEQVQQLIGQFTEGPDLGFLGDAGVNVLRLNLALDQLHP